MRDEQIIRALGVEDGIQTVSITMLCDLFIQHNKDEELSDETIKTRRTHLKQFSEFCLAAKVDDVGILSNQFLDRYFIHYRETHSRSTTNTGKRILKVFLIWVRDYKEIELRSIPETIHSAKEHDKKPKYIERSVIEEVARNCPKEQDRLIIAVFAETGVRISELINIKVSDVRGDELDIVGKGAVDRTVPITDELADCLRRYIRKEGRAPEDYLFMNTRHGYEGRMTKDTVWRHVKKHFKDIAGIEMTVHQLRHSYAINLLQSGCDIVTIKELMGHEDINTTMVYLRVSNQQVKTAYKRYIGKSFML